MTPNPSALATLENNSGTYFHLLSGDESGVLFGSNGVSTDGGIVYGAGLPRSLSFRTNGNSNKMIISDAGNISLGNFVPVYPLHFPATLGDKISVFGNGAAHYGFGVQSALLQMHSAGITDDIAFGYGSSAAFTENVRFKGSGNVGIGLSNPLTKLHVKTNSSGLTPNPYALSTIENNTYNYFHLLSGDESGVLFGSNGVSTDGAIVYSPIGNSRYMMFRTNGNIDWMTISDTGNVGIGTITPTVPLQFASSRGDKVSLWGSGANHYGLGMQSNLLQIHSDFDYRDIALGYGSSGAFTENVRFTGDGKVGIGNSNPTVPLQFAFQTGDKISFWGDASANYGIGIQDYLLQIYGSGTGDAIAFGFGNSTSMTETVRFKGNGNVGIGSNNPLSKLHVKDHASGMTPNTDAQLTLENDTTAYLNLLANGESGILFGRGTTATDGAIVYNTNGMLFRNNSNTTRMVISDTGNTGLGNFIPAHPLHFPATVGDKISLFGGAGNHYGFGIQGSLLQIHAAGPTDDIAFGYGSSAAFTERMRIKGTGEVGIGTSTPTAELEVNGFTKMGTTAPAVKMLKFTGTTAALQGNSTVILHGLTSSKILSVAVLVEYTAGSSVPPSYNASTGYEYDYFVSAAGITVWNKAGNSANILSKPFRILVTYEE